MQAEGAKIGLDSTSLLMHFDRDELDNSQVVDSH